MSYIIGKWVFIHGLLTILLSNRSLRVPIKPLHKEEAKKDFSTKSRFFANSFRNYWFYGIKKKDKKRIEGDETWKLLLLRCLSSV